MSESLFHDNFYAMGTRFEAVFWDLDSAFARSLFEEIHDEVNRLEAELSHYDEKSPVSAINKNAGVKPVPIPEPVMSALKQCRRHFEATDGLFDITAPAAAKAAENTANLLTGTSGAPSNFNLLQLSDEKGTAFLEEQGMEIDLGGIGKGIALERVEQIIDGYQVEHALISFGESSILTRGHHPHGPTWKIGISDLFDRKTSRYRFELNNHALSTSGNTPRNEGHVRDPRTGRPLSNYQTLSVQTASPVEAEVLSTVLLVADKREKQQILDSYNPHRAVRISYDRHGRNTDVTELNKSHFI